MAWQTADIIAFQETKVTRSELDREFALVEGWYVSSPKLCTVI